MVPEAAINVFIKPIPELMQLLMYGPNRRSIYDSTAPPVDPAWALLFADVAINVATAVLVEAAAYTPPRPAVSRVADRGRDARGRRRRRRPELAVNPS